MKWVLTNDKFLNLDHVQSIDIEAGDEGIHLVAYMHDGKSEKLFGSNRHLYTRQEWDFKFSDLFDRVDAMHDQLAAFLKDERRLLHLTLELIRPAPTFDKKITADQLEAVGTLD